MDLPYFLYASCDKEGCNLSGEAMSLLQHHTELHCVKDGFDLILKLQKVESFQSFPSLIIMDSQLPRLNASQTLTLLKSDDLYRLLPVVIFLEELSATEITHCRQLGADLHHKPVDLYTWLDLLQAFHEFVDE